MSNATPIASLALLMTIPLAIVAFSQLRPARAVLVMMIGSVLFLPERVGWDLPGLPSMDKTSLPILCSLVGAWAVARKHFKSVGLGSGVDLLILLMVVGEAGTVLTNRDPLQYGPTVLPGHAPLDVPKWILNLVISQVGAYLLGRIFFRTEEDAKDLLRAMVVGAVVYVPFIMVEWRLSPQWHTWVYGFFPHAFDQTKRGGGWRPVVFMHHGLELALYTATSGIAAWALVKAKVKVWKLPAKATAGLLSVVLVMSNSLGALVFGVVGQPLVMLTKPRTQMRVVVVLAALVAVYPVLRVTDVFPTDYLVNLAAKAGQDRAGSLKFRFDNEDRMMEKGLLRPMFGWGGYARSHVFNQQGRDESVVDGAWLGTFGARGIVGYVARFGMLLTPLVLAAARFKRFTPTQQQVLAGVCLVTALYSVDLLPNGLFNLLPFFFSGAVLSLSRCMTAESAQKLDPERVRALLEHLARLSQAASGGTQVRLPSRVAARQVERQR